nr:ribosomal protein S3 [Pleonosporium sp.]
MSKKSNHNAIRLGHQQPWFFTLQHFGSTYSNNLIFIQLNFYNYLFNLFLEKKVNLIFKDFWWLNNKTTCNVYLETPPIAQYSQVTKVIKKYLQFWATSNTQIKIFFKPQWLNSSNFIYSYLVFLGLKFNNSILKIFTTLILHFSKQFNSSKVTFLITGPIKLKLVGFKIRIKGRFENSKTQMASTNEYKFGVTSTVNLTNKIQFFSEPIFTTLGSCSVIISLFYSQVL